MRYLQVAVHQDPARRHPMHQYVVETGGYTVSRMLEFGQPTDGTHALLFHVEGPVEPYESTLADVDSVLQYALSPCPDESFFVYVRERVSDYGAAFVDALSMPGLLVVTPIEFRADGTIRVTAVGPAKTLQAAVDEVPGEMDVEVLEVGEYDARKLDAGANLTDRQFEAVLAAVDAGYYETPREGTVAEVGERLDCAPGTAAELLRRAESAVMGQLASTGPF
jgi:hypothetical protein